MVAADDVRAALASVVDPALDRPITELGMVADVTVDGGRVTVELAEPGVDLPARDELVRAVRAAVAPLEGVDDVGIVDDLMDIDEAAAVLRALGFSAGGNQLRESVFKTGDSSARVIAVSSGKGGVGKSSLTTNLAVALAGLGDGKAGARSVKVGALDADVWGFSVPRMIGIDRPPSFIGAENQGFVIPPMAHGVRVVSMGFFVDEDRPVMWRGPMLHKAMEQFLCDVYWGDLDYLVIDMPPGTGDISLSMAQFLPTAEILVVTTPQAAAQRVAQRAGKMAEKVNHRVIGVVENMSWLELPDGSRQELFGAGGGAQLSEDLEVPLLGQVPLSENLRIGADEGDPIVASDPSDPAAAAIIGIAEAIHAMGRRKIRRPSLKITAT